MHQSFLSFSNSNIIEQHPSIFVEGRPGVGKSQSIHQLSKDLAASTHKKVVVTDIRLLLFNPVDLRGIPIADKENLVAIWLKPQIFQLDESDSVINILFLDELTAAPLSVLAAAYQIVLDRKLGEHTLPKNTFLIAAGNGVNDGAISQSMPSALKNRFIHFKIEEDFASWKEWAKSRIHARILNFLDRYPYEFTSSDMKTKSNIIITPRSWETLSKLLYQMPEDEDVLKWIITSVVGDRIAHKMLHVESSLSADVINGNPYEIPHEIHAIHQVTEELSLRIDEFIHDKDKTNNVLIFLNEIPIDYAISLFKEVIQFEIFDFVIEALDPYTQFIQKLDAVNHAH
jgi:MoxR-like ATPase